MKYFLLAINLFFILVACTHNVSDTKQVEIISDQVFLQETQDSTKTTKEILDKFLPSVLAIALADTSCFYYGDNVFYNDSTFRQIIIGKFLDSSNIIAIEMNVRDAVINFFTVENEKWKQIGSEKTHINVYKIVLEELSGDSINEIIITTCNNMNANSWKEIYFYSPIKRTIKYAGSFSTDYIVKKDKKQIEETYEGSGHMDISKTLYEWRKEYLIPVKRIIISHDSLFTPGKLTFEYYENITKDRDSLRLKYKKPHNDDNEKGKELWDNFFNE